MDSKLLNFSNCKFAMFHRCLVNINPESGSKCGATKGRSKKTGKEVTKKANQVDLKVINLIRDLGEFEWTTN